MNAALLAAVAELDALRLAYAEGEVDDHEIYTARRRVWRLENRLARRPRQLSRAERVRQLYRFCLDRRPHLQGA